jgi:hypothetical protein
MREWIEDAVGVVLLFALGYGMFLLGYGMGL